MKTGRTLTELAAEIERQRTTRRDFIAPTDALEMFVPQDDESARMLGAIGINIGDDFAAGINDLAHRQVGDYVGIPAKYYDRMRTEAPHLLTNNVNHWFDANPEPRMARTLDGRLRALLSDRYRPLENFDLAETVLPILAERSDLSIVSCEITERRLYIKAVDRSVVRQVGGNHIIDGRSVPYDHASPSLTVSNSEVGNGSLSVERGMFKHGCRNMALFRERSLKKYHIGGRHELGEEVVRMLSDETRAATDKAVWLQVADVVRGALSAEHFDRAIVDIQAMADRRITGSLDKVVEVACKTLAINDGERPSILRHLVEGGDLTQFGLFNAVTRAAEDLADYDRATDFERIGGSIIELPANDWKVIAEAA